MLGAFFVIPLPIVIRREINMIPASITNNPKLPASKAKSFNWIRIKIKLYNRVNVAATYAASLVLPKTLLAHRRTP